MPMDLQYIGINTGTEYCPYWPVEYHMCTGFYSLRFTGKILQHFPAAASVAYFNSNSGRHLSLCIKKKQ